MATIANALDYKLPKKSCAEDSHNLLPLIEGKASAEPIRTAHIHNTKAKQYAIRSGDWLLVDSKTGYVSGRNQAWENKRNYPADNKAPVELYNLKDDIGQKNNLANKHTDKVKELQALLKEIRERGHSAPRLR